MILKNSFYKFSSIFSIVFIIIIWAIVSESKVLPDFILPTPLEVFSAFLADYKIILHHLMFTFFEAIFGLFISIVVAFFTAILMDRYKILHKILYPILIIIQTIPTICLAPLIILWFGFGFLSKVILIVIICSFPVLMSVLNGFDSIDKEVINLLKSMDANYFQTLVLAKIPFSLKEIFSGIKIATSYSIIGAIISEWLGGENGLGVYMTRVRKSFNFDKMFAVIILTSFLSIILIEIIKFIEKRIIKWEE